MGLLVTLGGAVAWWPISLDVLGPLQRWAADRSSRELAENARRIARDAGFVIVRRGVILTWVAQIPVLIWATLVLDAGWEVAPAAVALGSGTVLTAWVIEVFLIDVALKPIVRELASQGSLGSDDPGLTRHLRTKLLVTVPSAAFFGAYLTGSFILDLSSPAARLYTVLGAAAAVTLAFSGPVVAIATASILDPVRDLIAATERVGEGDLSQPVPQMTTDEFGALARSFNRMQEGLREREALHRAVGSYVDPAIAERVVVEGEAIKGEAADVTVMFVDIVGFTGLAEGADPEEVVSDLNDFFEVVIPAIEGQWGHANKLLGDGLMAVFGVPKPLHNHADLALAAAREIDLRLHECYGDELRVGIGLNSGMVVVGSMGGGRKLDYTIVGDPVNVASRVEAHTRQTGDTILVSAATRDLLSTDGLRFEPRGAQALRGRREAVELFALVGGRLPDDRTQSAGGR